MTGEVGPFGDLSLKPICPPGYLNPCIAIVALAGFVLEDWQFGFHWSHKSCLEMRAFRNIIYDRGSDKYTCCDILKSYPQGTDITVPYPKLICFSGKWKQRKMHARAALPYPACRTSSRYLFSLWKAYERLYDIDSSSLLTAGYPTW